MSSSPEYTPPKVWVWNKASGGRFANINRPIAGPDPGQGPAVGEHPMQLYSLGTPNGVKVTIMLEELLAAGPHGAEYDAWLIRISEGTSSAAASWPRTRIPRSRSGRPQRPDADPGLRVGRDPDALGREFGAFLPTEPAARAETLSWLFWQMGSAPFLGGGFGHFYAYAPTKIEYAIDRYAMEAKRQMDVLDRRLAETRFVAGDEYTIADMAIWPWYGGLAKGWLYGAAEFLQVQDYTNVQRWAEEIIGAPP
jgi:GST-like protein